MVAHNLKLFLRELVEMLTAQHSTVKSSIAVKYFINETDHEN
jgi:hypothetical protein